MAKNQVGSWGFGRLQKAVDLGKEQRSTAAVADPVIGGKGDGHKAWLGGRPSWTTGFRRGDPKPTSAT